MITPELKDQLLNELVNSGLISGSFSIDEMAQEKNIDPDVIDAILYHFEELNFFEFQRMIGGNVVFRCNVSAHDFVRRGGFVAQEELLKKNIEKLIFELKSLKKSVPDGAASISTIISGISSAIALFK